MSFRPLGSLSVDEVFLFSTPQRVSTLITVNANHRIQDFSSVKGSKEDISCIHVYIFFLSHLTQWLFITTKFNLAVKIKAHTKIFLTVF